MITWADSATCPAVRTVMENMRTIRMPSPAPYGLPGGSDEIMMDGTGYTLTAPSSDTMGKLTLSAMSGSPLGQWVEDSLRQLEPCWKPAIS